MAGNPRPEDVVSALEKGELAPFYLFYGPNEFLLERVLGKIKKDYIPENARDFNMEICYGGETNPSDVINRARTVPFLSSRRLIILRRTDSYKADHLAEFLPYLEKPVNSTCLIFICSKTDFKKKFYKTVRSSGFAVNFAELATSQMVPWMMETARELELNINRRGCVLLQEITGNRLRDIYSELEKMKLSYGERKITEQEVKEMAINSRIYSIFELMDALSVKNLSNALSVLKRFLEEEDRKKAPLQIIGMLNRQIGLLWQSKEMSARRMNANEIASRLGIAPFSVRNLLKQAGYWTVEELERGISLMYEADRFLKSGSRAQPVLENLILSLCA